LTEIKQYDIVRLKDGREGCVVEVYGNQEHFDVDVGLSPEDWETVSVRRDEIIPVQSMF
jgi:hypothetical protein